MLSLLNLYDPVGEIPAAVFSDVSLDRLLSKGDLATLSRVCAPEDISARQEIFKLLEDSAFYGWLHGLYLRLKNLDKSKYLFENSAHEVERCALFCGCAESYVLAVEGMKNTYKTPLLEALNAEAVSRDFQTEALKEGIAEHKKLWDMVSNNLLRISPDGVYVNHAEGGAEAVEKTVYKICERLGYPLQEAQKPAGTKMSPRLAVALTGLWGGEFRRMSELREELLPLINPDILRLSGDLEFYFSLNRLRQRAAERGAAACFPEISAEPCYTAHDLFDVSLLLKDGAKIVPNDLDMTPRESAFFIRGANGGGKTTFLRAAAINLIMFLGGCPVYAKSAKIYPFTRIFTHFPENEGFGSGGRLENEEKRLRDAVKAADKNSFMIFNETFSGADEHRGTELSLELMNRLAEKGAFALFVTHFHGVCEGDIPSLTTVVSGGGNERTFKIVRQEGGRSSYARDILKKHGLDRDSLRRLKNDKSAL